MIVCDIMVQDSIYTKSYTIVDGQCVSTDRSVCHIFQSTYA